MQMLDNATVTTINTQGVLEDIAGVTTAGTLNERFTHATGPKILTYIGKADIKVIAHASISGRRDSGAAVVRVEGTLLKDSGAGFVVITGANFGADFTNRNIGFAFAIGVTLCTDDKLKMQIANVDGTDDILIEDFVMSVD